MISNTILAGVTRLGYFAHKDKIVYGQVYRRELRRRAWWQKALGIRYKEGTYTDFASLTRIEAHNAFDSLCAEGGVFALETKEGTRIDFLPQGHDWVALDVWSLNDSIEDGALRVADAHTLVGLIFDTNSDEQIANFIRGCNET
jgi:hypothetical protein